MTRLPHKLKEKRKISHGAMLLTIAVCAAMGAANAEGESRAGASNTQKTSVEALPSNDQTSFEQKKAELVRALDEAEKKYGTKHDITIKLFDRIAQLYFEFGPEHPDTASILHDTAKVYLRTGAYDKALPLLQRSLTIREKIFSADHHDTATSLDTLGVLYLNMHAYDKALPLIKRGLAIREKLLGAENLATARSLNNLGMTYQFMGAYDKALPLFQRSLTIQEEFQGFGFPEIEVILNNLAVLYLYMGIYDNALPFAQRSLAVAEKDKGADHSATALSLSNLGMIYQLMGAYDKALPLAQRSLEIYEKIFGTDHLATALSLNNLATFYMAIGAYEKAQPLCQRSLKIQEIILGAEHPDVATSLNNLASLYRAMDAYDKALPLYQRSLAIREKILGSEHPQTATVLGNLASLYQKIGAYDKALPLFQRSLAIREKTFVPEHPETALSIYNLGYFYLATGETEKANEHFLQALPIAQSQPGTGMALVPVQYGFFRANKRQQHNETAILWGKAAVNTLQSVRTSLKDMDRTLQSGFLGQYRDVYNDLADLLIAEGRISEAQIVLQMLKEQELYDGLQRSSKHDPRTSNIELTGLERKRFAKYYEINDQQIALCNERERLALEQKTGEITPAGKARLDEINNRLLPTLSKAMKQFVITLQEESDTYAKDKAYRQDEVMLAQVEINLQKMLKQAKASAPGHKAVALQYVVTDNRLSILLSTAGNPPLARQVEFDGKKLNQAVNSIRGMLETPRSDAGLVKEALQSLYAQLIAPVEADLKASGARTLVLVPNDVLRYIPFAALYDGRKYLVEDYALVLFNEAVKKEFKAAPAKPSRLLAMGLTHAVEDLPPLENVPDELRAITSNTGFGGKIYLDDDFSRPVLKNGLKQNYDILHLASHFKFVPGRPDASRLFLGDRSSLYLGEIAREDMRFDGFSLVTLSACETGLGGGLYANGQEMESLGALVQNQGAGAVMNTLWKVSDFSTPDLMEKFYRARHQDGMDMAQALRTTQLSFIRNNWGGSREKWKHPYYWAPFVLMGDWR